MAKIVECIPNISEGRNMEVVEAVLNEVRSTPGVTLLDHIKKTYHYRGDRVSRALNELTGEG